MSNLNKVFLMGRLTRDPELRATPQGTPVTEIGIAVNRRFTDHSGQKREDTVFVDVTLWSKQAETVCKFLRKGQPLFVEGRLSLDSWETPEGQKRSRLRVVGENFQFIGARPDRDGEFPSEPAGGSERAVSRAPARPAPEFEYEAGRGGARSASGGSSWAGGPPPLPSSSTTSSSSRESEGQDVVDDSEIPF